ncbi:hypothetical protein RJ641_023372 [Dillenia turbinata]|uniref:Uncharacterized protein n=1 Tax=Dillenia turbinata TaxID=194707 RepID=A0AAN8YQC3_9MAGN
MIVETGSSSSIAVNGVEDRKQMSTLIVIQKIRKATKELRAMGMETMIVGVTACSLESEKQAFMEAGLNECL